MSIFTGSGVALVTPFTEDDRVDFEALERLLEFQIENGTDAIVVIGTTGEAATMSDQEKNDAIAFTVKHVAGRVPVIAGTGSNETRHVIDMSRKAEALGADALLIVTPYYNRTSQQGLYDHYKAVAESVTAPIVLYNVPGRTGMNLLPQTILRLTEFDNIRAVKEASGILGQVLEIKNLCDDRIEIFSGDDDIIVPVLSVGGQGVISVLANILPRETHDICERFFNGDLKGSLELQLKYKHLINAIFCEPNPIMTKTALNLMGMSVGHLRLPLANPTQESLDYLKREMEKVGLPTDGALS